MAKVPAENISRRKKKRIPRSNDSFGYLGHAFRLLTSDYFIHLSRECTVSTNRYRVDYFIVVRKKCTKCSRNSYFNEYSAVIIITVRKISKFFWIALFLSFNKQIFVPLFVNTDDVTNQSRLYD